MKIGIIVIGNEILGGFTIDKNAAWIGQTLLNEGLRVHRKITVLDQKNEIIRAFDSLSEDCDIVISTGGLGPTIDDITTSTLFDYFNDKPIYDESYWNKLKLYFNNKGMEIPPINRNQCYQSTTGKMIPNLKGSARGLFYHQDDKKYFILPGVPMEMKAMFEEFVLTEILKQTSEKFFCRSINTAAIAESLIHEKIIHLIESEHYQGCEVSFLPHKMFGVDIRIMSTNRVVMDKLVDEIALILQENIYGYDGETLIESVTQALLSQKLTISVAESCTGGLLGETFTNIAGSSAFFKGGVICYSDELKKNLVNVSEETLKKFGAVSYEVAEELCRNIAHITATDIGVGITGVAGPGGGSKEKPVGLVFIGIFYQNNLYIHEYNLTSDRKTNRELSITLCLNELRKILIK